MMYNFLQGIPKELDEAAKIDGCSYYTIYTHIALPLMVPALVTSGISHLSGGGTILCPLCSTSTKQQNIRSAWH